MWRGVKSFSECLSSKHWSLGLKNYFWGEGEKEDPSSCDRGLAWVENISLYVNIFFLGFGDLKKIYKEKITANAEQANLLKPEICHYWLIKNTSNMISQGS